MYGAFLNSFYQKVKWLIGRLGRIKDRIAKQMFKRENVDYMYIHTHTHIYVCVCVSVRVCAYVYACKMCDREREREWGGRIIFLKQTNQKEQQT